jgi:hypothetical protein
MTVTRYGDGQHLAIAEQDGVTDFAVADTEDEARARALHRLRERMARWGFLRAGGAPMSGGETPDLLRDRLVLAALNALAEGDPLLIIGVGDNEVRLGWVDHDAAREPRSARKLGLTGNGE